MEKNIDDITVEINKLSEELNKLYYFAIDHKFVPSDKFDEIYLKRLFLYHENNDYVDTIRFELKKNNLKNDVRFLIFGLTYLISLKVQSLLASLLSVYGMADNILLMNGNFSSVYNEFDKYNKNLDKLSDMKIIINNICNYVKDDNSFAYTITFIENYFMESGYLLDTDLNEFVKEHLLLDYNINLESDSESLTRNK